MVRVKIKTIEISAAVLFFAFGALIFYKCLELGAGWTYAGPEAGFFPIVLTVLILIGSASVLYSAVRHPNNEPFFEVSQEVVDLLKVGLPVLFSIALLPYLGIFIVSGLYIGLFMIYYGDFKWWQAAFAGILLPVILWFLLRQAFNLAMPMSWLYSEGVLPF